MCAWCDGCRQACLRSRGHPDPDRPASTSPLAWQVHGVDKPHRAPTRLCAPRGSVRASSGGKAHAPHSSTAKGAASGAQATQPPRRHGVRPLPARRACPLASSLQHLAADTVAETGRTALPRRPRRPRGTRARRGETTRGRRAADGGAVRYSRVWHGAPTPSPPSKTTSHYQPPPPPSSPTRRTTARYGRVWHGAPTPHSYPLHDALESPSNRTPAPEHQLPPPPPGHHHHHQSPTKPPQAKRSDTRATSGGRRRGTVQQGVARCPHPLSS